MKEARGKILFRLPSPPENHKERICHGHGHLSNTCRYRSAKDSIAVAIGDGDTEVVRAFPLSRDGLADLIRFLEPYGPFPETCLWSRGVWPLHRTSSVLAPSAERPGLAAQSSLISRFRRAQSLRRTKTDAIDARTILHFIGQLPPSSVQPCELGDDLQTLAAEYERITQQVARLKTQIRQQVHALLYHRCCACAQGNSRSIRMVCRGGISIACSYSPQCSSIGA